MYHRYPVSRQSARINRALATWPLRLIGVVSLADGLFLAFNPTGWTRWWQPWLAAIGEGRLAARLTAIGELAIGLYLIWLTLPSLSKAREE
jgi:hypothetical protein